MNRIPILIQGHPGKVSSGMSPEGIREEVERQLNSGDIELLGYAKSEDIPENVGELINDSGYQTATEVDAAIDAKLSGYQPAITVDSALSDMSTNPVENKAVKIAIDELAVRVEGSHDYEFGWDEASTELVMNEGSADEQRLKLTGIAKLSDVQSATVDSVLSDTSENPVQNKAIKAALDNITTGGGVIVDTSLSDTSTNPVQNKVVKEGLNSKLDKNKLTQGYRISISDTATGEIVIAYVPGDDEITASKVREIIADSNLASKDDISNLASKDDIPTNISDLNNDSGFVKTSELSPVAISGNYSDVTGTPDPYDDSELRALIANLNTMVSGLNDKVTELDETVGDMTAHAVPPTFTEPSLTISGTDISTEIPAGQTKNATITLTFDRGSISTGGNTVGAATGYSLNGGAYQTSNVFNVTVSETNKTFKGKVQYGVGDQPTDSKGANYGIPRPAGEIESTTIEYQFAAAPPSNEETIWSNAANILNVVKMTDVKESDKQWSVHWVPQTEENPEIFDVPASWNVTAIETINNLTNMWQTIAQSFDVSDTTHDGVAYKRYTDNREYDDSGRSIRVTWS